METKLCNKCGEEKELGEFYFKKDKGIYTNPCKECRKLQNKQKYIPHPKKIIDVSEYKVCSICGLKKDIGSFYIMKRNGKPQQPCKECYSIKRTNERIHHPIIKKQLSEIKTIICSKCGIEKSSVEFNIRKDLNIYRTECKECQQKYSKKYHKNNKERLAPIRKIYRENNKEKLQNDSKKYRENNKEKILKANRLLLKNNKQYHIKKVLSRNINGYLKKNGFSKNGVSCLIYLPYTILELKTHIESQFKEWMNWDNYGSYKISEWDDNDPSTWKWNIDHIIPHSFFHYETMDCDEFRKCWGLENLRPYSAKQNIIDGNRRDRSLYIASDNDNEELDRNVNAL